MSDVKHYTPVATIDARTHEPVVAMASDCGEFIGGNQSFVRLADYEQLQARCSEPENRVRAANQRAKVSGKLLAEMTDTARELQSEKAQQQERIAELDQIVNAGPRLEPYRSGGFINRDYDMARISFELPIIEAKKLMAKLQQPTPPTSGGEG